MILDTKNKSWLATSSAQIELKPKRINEWARGELIGETKLKLIVCNDFEMKQRNQN